MLTNRVTTNGMLHIYRKNLMNSYNTLATASEKVQTGRNFLSYAEDPASATLAFKLRREYWQTDTQLANTKTLQSKFGQAFEAFDLVKEKLVSETAHANALRKLNDPDGTARKALAESTREAAETIVQSMNVKYAGRYVFAGADGKNAPFSIEERPVYNADGTQVMTDDTPPQPVMSEQLCYRGISVDTPAKINGQDNEAYLNLRKMLDETTYVDIGLGMQENPDGTPNKATVYNSALSGLEFLDFGLQTGDDGDTDTYPKNVVSLMLQISDLASKASDMDGQWHEEEDGSYTNNSDSYDKLFRLTGQLEKAMDKLDTEFVELSTKQSFLNNNQTRLETELDELTNKVVEVEDINPAAAITALSWAQYCYNAGLKIGNSILSQSLIDYMS